MSNPNNNMNAYNQALQINRDLKKKLDKSFTIDEIKDAWFSIYNEKDNKIINSRKVRCNVPDFFDELEQRLK